MGQVGGALAAVEGQRDDVGVLRHVVAVQAHFGAVKLAIGRLPARSAAD
jgi:hypothetical protein